MNNLYDDLLLEIFSHLTIVEKFNCSNVCHRWSNLIQHIPVYSLKICKKQDHYHLIQPHFNYKCDNLLHQSNSLNVIYYNNFEQLEAIIIKILPKLKKLKAIQFDLNSLFELSQINLTSIKELEVEHFEICYRQTVCVEGVIEKILFHLTPKLKHLIIEPKQITGTEFFLSALNSRLSSYFGRVGLELVENSCPNLEIFKFEPLPFLIESLHPIRLPPKLKCLSLPKVRISTTDLINFIKFNHSNLIELNFFDINVSILKIICSLTNLQVLRLGKIRINDSKDLKLLCNLKNLKHLQIKLHFKCIDDVLREIMLNLPKIQRLCLINCNLKNETIKEMCIAWPKLEYLELNNRFNQNLTDQCLDYLFNMKCLKSLGIPFSSITNQALFNFIENSSIEQLDVSNCPNIDEKIIHAMVQKSLKNQLCKYYLIILGHKFFIKENLCKNLSILLD